ncbi:MAG: penicillin-binding protein 1A, partial [Pannonibacter indicus]
MIKFFGYLFGIGTVLGLLVAAGVWIYLEKLGEDLPDYTALKNYEPPVMTRVHAADGSLMAEYAKQRRLFLPIQAMPDILKEAYISAEDKNFYSHVGIDPEGIARAVVRFVQNFGSGRRPEGASTITQQVAKNFLLTNELSVDRKIKEAILSLRIEQAYTKDEILELYLNEIYLGLGAYGVAAASLVYFDKSVHELSLEEVAYLAALPKAPNNYHPFRGRERAIERRNWVIDRMVENGYVSAADAEAAKAKPLTVKPRETGSQLFAAEYFTEEVRRQVASIYGENSLYEGGLSVRSSLDPKMQATARKVLMNGLLDFDQKRGGGWRGPVTTIPVAGDWGVELGKVEALSDLPEWRLAVVLEAGQNTAQVGLQPRRLVSGALEPERETATLQLDDMKWARVSGRAPNSANDVLNPGDVVYVEAPKNGGRYQLRQVPRVSGALVAMDPFTGRVLALVGGFSFAQSEFNRATQAWRQPGSSFKPFVYAAALDNGYTPSSVVLDAPIELAQAGQATWRPQNYGGKFYGPSTLRTGIELSRNLMTIRLAQDMGMPLVAEYAKRFGIYDNMISIVLRRQPSGQLNTVIFISFNISENVASLVHRGELIG